MARLEREQVAWEELAPSGTNVAPSSRWLRSYAWMEVA